MSDEWSNNNEYRQEGASRGYGDKPRRKFNDNGEREGGFKPRGEYKPRGRNNDEDGGGERNGYGGGGGGGKPRRRYNDDDNECLENGGGFDDANAGGGGGGNDERPKVTYVPPELPETEDEMFRNGIETGINFDKYDDIPVTTSGDNVPPPIENFKDANLRAALINNIDKSGYKKPTPIQKATIPIVMNDRDLMACAQTGSGKTAAFLLPIINSIMENNYAATISKPIAVVVSPTRELAVQIFNEARKFAHGTIVKCAVVYGGVSTRHQSDNLKSGAHIVIATPGRLADFVRRNYIEFDETRYVVLDEADRMLDMGFKDEVEKLMKNPTMRAKEERRVLMFSATFPDDIQRLAGEFLTDYLFVTVGVVGGACNDVEQEIIEVNRNDKRKKLVKLLDQSAKGTIVFVETKRNADFLAAFLSEGNHPTTSIHGDRLQSQREEALRDFKSGKMDVLIATSVAARGLDIKNVKHVVNYDLPKGIDDYVHRIGRTGRLGNRGKATSFFDPENDSSVAKDLVNILKGANQEVPDFLLSAGGSGGGFGGSNAYGGQDCRNDGGGEEEEW